MLTFIQFLENTKAFFTLIFYIWTLWPWEIIKALFISKKRKDITGEIMFITGAGSGIGRLMAIKFASCGAIVICTDINKDTSEETAEMIKKNGHKAYSFKLDVTDRTAVYKLANQIREEIGDVTMLVNNAGIANGRRFMECPDELMIKTVEVNTIAHFWTLKAFLGDMMKKNQGHIITIASIAGHCGSPKLVDYCSSKHGAVGLHDTLSIELASEAPGVKTTSICPGMIRTGMFEGIESRSPITIPLLDPEYTADTIVSSVLNDEEIVFIPRSLAGAVMIKSLAPASIMRKVNEYLKLDEQVTQMKCHNIERRDTKKTE